MASKSIISPTTCGFAKVFVYNVLNEDRSNGGKKLVVEEKHYAKYIEHFQECYENFPVPYKTFRLYFPKILENFKCLQKKRTHDKATILKVFAADNWNKLSYEQKWEHRLYDCKECLGNAELKKTISLFHITTFYKKVAEDHGIQTERIDVARPTCTSRKRSRDDVKSLVEERVPKYILDVYSEAIASTCVKDAINSKKETSVDRYYGGRTSICCLNEHRMVDGFESKKDAGVRTLQDNLEISAGLKKRHKPIGDLEKLADTWRSQECLDYVNILPDGANINFSLLARNFGLKDVNCKQKDNKGQVVKEFLKSKGVDVEKFTYHAKVNEEGVHNIRRKKKKISSYKRISVPMDPTPQQVAADLISKVEEGKYTLGELVVPIKFKKIVVTKDGDVKEEEFSLCGRKDRLINIRQNLYERHKLYYRVPKSDDEIEKMTKEDVIRYLTSINEDICSVDDDVEKLKDRLKYFQRRRHLMMWHDGATICNHGHVLFTCSEVYDIAIHLTDQEALHKYGRKVDVQVGFVFGNCSKILLS